MARSKTTTSTSTTTSTHVQHEKETRRISSLEPRAGKSLSSLEEAVVRMHHGVSLKPTAELASNGVTDELMADLIEREVDAYVKSGRVDELPDLPEPRPRATSTNPATQRLVDALKKKS